MRTKHRRLIGIAVLAGLTGLIGRRPESVTGQDSGVQMIAVEGEGARYWSRWRGPFGQGLVSGSGYPDAWSATRNIVWKAPTPGNGNSSPIVWGDRILPTTAYDRGRRPSVLAYNRPAVSRSGDTSAAAGGGEGRRHMRRGA